MRKVLDMGTWVKKNFIYIILLLSITLYTFWDIRLIFYQQDEWKVLGEYFAMNSFREIFDRVNSFKAILGEGRILSLVTGYLLLKGFPFESYPLALYSFLLHFLNGILVYWLGNKLIGNKLYSLVAAIFFIVCAVSYNTVSWYSTSIGTLPAVSLILLSVLFFWKGIEGKNKYSFLAFFLLFFSQLFKEIGYFLFLFLPLSEFLYKRLNVKTFLKKYWYFLATFFTVSVYRVSQLNSYSSESVVFTQTGSSNFLLTVLLRVILYPFTSISLVYFPSDFFISAGKIFTNSYYPFFPSEHYNLIVQSAVLDLLAIIFSFLIILISIFVSIKNNKLARKNIIFTFILIISSYLPYTILSKNYSYLDSRYYYLGAASAGILLGFLVLGVTSLFKKFYLKSAVFLLAVLFLVWHVGITKSGLKDLANISIERKDILNQILKFKPTLDERNVFYIEGDRQFYLSEGNPVPFQQGFGYTLLVWLDKDRKQFKDLLKVGALWDLGSQGYFETGSGSFGYFRDKNLLTKTLREKQLTQDFVTAFYYDSKDKKLKKLNLELNPDEK